MRHEDERDSTQMEEWLWGVIGFVAGIGFVCLAVFTYLWFGALPVAVTDPAFPFEKAIVHVPLDARINREMIGATPLQATPEILAGASVYKQQCAFCHGLPG